MSKSLSYNTYITCTDIVRLCVPLHATTPMLNLYFSNWKSNPRCNRADSCAAICEWCLAFMVAFYESSLSIDLSPRGSVGVRKQIIKEQTLTKVAKCHGWDRLDSTKTRKGIKDVVK
jgi:hypothetical protein